jgi:hypothetical protein
VTNREQAARLIHQDLSSTFLIRERNRLPDALFDDEKLIDLEGATIGFGPAGILAVTDQRIFHLRFRRLVRRFALFALPYDQIGAVRARFWRSHAQLCIWLLATPDVLYVPIRSGSDRASELAKRIEGLAHRRR